MAYFCRVLVYVFGAVGRGLACMDTFCCVGFVVGWIALGGFVVWMCGLGCVRSRCAV